MLMNERNIRKIIKANLKNKNQISLNDLIIYETKMILSEGRFAGNKGFDRDGIRFTECDLSGLHPIFQNVFFGKDSTAVEIFKAATSKLSQFDNIFTNSINSMLKLAGRFAAIFSMGISDNLYTAFEKMFKVIARTVFPPTKSECSFIVNISNAIGNMICNIPFVKDFFGTKCNIKNNRNTENKKSDSKELIKNLTIKIPTIFAAYPVSTSYLNSLNSVNPNVDVMNEIRKFPLDSLLYFQLFMPKSADNLKSATNGIDSGELRQLKKKLDALENKKDSSLSKLLSEFCFIKGDRENTKELEDLFVELNYENFYNEPKEFFADLFTPLNLIHEAFIP